REIPRFARNDGLVARLYRSAVCGGLMGPRSRDECFEEPLRECILGRHPLGMPLHSDDPVFVRLMLDGFDDAIGSHRGQAKSVPQIPDGLMMRSVHLRIESAIPLWQTGCGGKLTEFATKFNPRRVLRILRFLWQTVTAVHDIGMQFAGDVLVKRAAQADVEALAAVADGENGFSCGEGVLDDGQVRFLTVRIGVVGFGLTWGSMK